MATTIKVQVPGRFYYDWSCVAEGYEIDAINGLAPKVAMTTIAKLDSATRIKCGKGFVLNLELTFDEAKFLKDEAWYRYEFNGTNAYEVSNKDYASARAAKKLFDTLAKKMQ